MLPILGNHRMISIKFTLCLAACLVTIKAYPEGAPLLACDNLIPLHPKGSTGEYYQPATEINPNITNPFTLNLSANTVQPGDSILGLKSHTGLIGPFY